ncbi:MAG TPA: SDR family oxidoreductase [Terriglobales bacterium]|nr:SDR family oxidoreductase [Terriglobales bacterium]
MANQKGVSMSVDGRVALVSGGSRGIGAATVRLFAAAAARVVFTYQKAQPEAEQLVKECGSDRCFAVQCDLNSAESAGKAVQAAVDRFGKLDILVANHGIWPDEDIAVEAMTVEHWRKTQAINVDAVFGLVKFAVPHLQKHGGHIVLVSSTSGQRGEAYHIDYSASKGAIISMTKTLSSELLKHNIRVNCVAPGWVATDMSASVLAKAETGAQIKATIPLGRVGTPEEIAGPILFLCTEHAGFISGEIFNVNGGAVLVG